ncbi:DEAD/DEAH box helicase [Polyangium sp. 6x1]|uniref:DEAD/DEAH box helicase n=1 Tax=Polyangium sp. 6x1 TaxID=3042689 RepID=UPI002482F24F|nr:DEAD/DEAH box helicase [Polyangium sp. 6x1]MDI1450813.1 DEAD/DEAH box helicase [Polyangium sp. 6x1]
MLTLADFFDVVRSSVPQFKTKWLDREQERVVSAPPEPPALVVAGPGAGKTTVLALRVLKHVFVDGMKPAGVIATTFTRKAAKELRSRLLSWGIAVHNEARRRANPAERAELDALDLNQLRVGTLDSLAEEFLTEARVPGAITPVTIEALLTSALVRQRALFQAGRFRDKPLEDHLGTLSPGFPGVKALPSKVGVVRTFADRVRHDEIDLNAYTQAGPGHAKLVEAVLDYFQHLEKQHMADFARLETLLLERLNKGTLAKVTAPLQALLVDEFQDTNYLQEQIYFAFLQNRPDISLTVVGDDDQSIYRFRGATVEIFASFATRIEQALGSARAPSRFDLATNYRSTKRLVDFCNAFLTIDSSYQPARAPGKKTIVAGSTHATVSDANIPVLGMFRDTREELARDLAGFLVDVFRGKGRKIQCKDTTFAIESGSGGDLGDAVLLAHKVAERDYKGEARLPQMLRDELGRRHVEVFNPRGRALGDVTDVSLLLGLAIECVDPGQAVLQGISTFPQDARQTLDRWVTAARGFISTNPAPGGLQKFVDGWRARKAATMPKWPEEWPFLELVFTLATWFPRLGETPEGQVYMEAIARTVAEVGQVNSYGCKVLNGQGKADKSALEQLYWNVFLAFANDDTDLDEEIMPMVPRKVFPIMTIHQAKGLEFPLVIVDVGSDYTRDHHAQRRGRFPLECDSVHVMEDLTASFSPVGPVRTMRSAVDRAWDDLRRLYFVAYSRPQDVLLLVGNTALIRTKKPVPSIALGDVNRAGPVRHMNFVHHSDWEACMSATHVALI